MHPEFWHERWAADRIGFHEAQPNPHLVGHFDRLALPQGARVFVPLAGKSVDMHWLAELGYRVVGIELSETAVQAFFNESDRTTVVREVGALRRYQSGDISLFAGDFFQLEAADLGPVDAIYDRAALVALPTDMRRRYAERLVEISGGAPQFLVTLDYDQTMTDGPPFAVDGSAVQSLYGQYYRAQCINEAEIGGPLGERCQGVEQAWLLTPRKSNS
jgi:thiopurine S-methyltransferase